jgi:hypothetical protein
MRCQIAIGLMLHKWLCESGLPKQPYPQGSTKVAIFLGMHVAAATKARSQSKLGRSKVTEPASSAYIISEINTFIAIRDYLLTEAEASKTREQINRASLANQVVETCLRPARHPYEAQCLPEADAIRERKRCQAAESRITKLHANL